MFTNASISVIVQVYNSERFVRDALESILSQGPWPLEILVVDGGSTDRSADIVSSYPDVRLVSLSDCGLAAARNRGIREARGEFIAFLDADDRWAAEKLRAQMDHLAQNPGCDVVFGLMRRFLSNGCPLPRHYHAETFEYPVPAYTPGAMVARRRLFDQAGSFDENLSIGCDSEWMMRIVERGAASSRVLPVVVLHKRIHDKNLSARLPTYRKDLLSALHRSLHRRGRFSIGFGG